MVDLMVVGGVAVALAGVIGISEWRQRWLTDSTSLIRDAMASAQGPEAEALRAEFRRSGVTPPERLGASQFRS